MQGEAALVGVANAVWRKSPQRAAMAVDRLMTLRLVSAEAIVGWVFGSAGVTALGDESLSGAAWEILYNAINKTIARVQVCVLAWAWACVCVSVSVCVCACMCANGGRGRGGLRGGLGGGGTEHAQERGRGAPRGVHAECGEGLQQGRRY